VKLKTMYHTFSGFLTAREKDQNIQNRCHATHVRVSKFDKIILEITEQSQLDTFNAHWISKADTGKQNRMRMNEFQCSLGVEAKSGGGMWLYSSEGYVTKLDHISHRLYRIESPQEFNQLIGIAD
jgi:hypothetical protein